MSSFIDEDEVKPILSVAVTLKNRPIVEVLKLSWDETVQLYKAYDKRTARTSTFGCVSGNRVIRLDLNSVASLSVKTQSPEELIEAINA